MKTTNLIYYWTRYYCMLWLTLFLILLFLLFQKLIMGSFSSSIWLDLAIFNNSGKDLIIFYMIVVVQLLSHVWLFATPWTAEHQALLPFTISWNLLKLVFTESVMLSDHLTLCLPLLLPVIFPSVRVFSNELIGSSHQVAKLLELHLQHQSFQWIFRVDFP